MITEECHPEEVQAFATRRPAVGFVFGVRKMSDAPEFFRMAAKRPFGVCFLASHASAKNAERMGPPLLFVI
jgi:hypothetical protein